MQVPLTEQARRVLTLKEVTELLVRHHGLHEGLFDLTVELQFGIGNFGPTPEQTLPGAMIGVKGIGLTVAEVTGAHTVDAALVNPPAQRKVARARKLATG